MYTNAIQNSVDHIWESTQRRWILMFKVIEHKILSTNKQAVERCKELEMFINLFEGLLQFNHVDASQLARKQDCSKVSDWKASHSSLGKKFGGGAEKPQRQIPKYLSYDLYSAAIPSLRDNSGKDEVRLQEQNAWART